MSCLGNDLLDQLGRHGPDVGAVRGARVCHDRGLPRRSTSQSFVPCARSRPWLEALLHEHVHGCQTPRDSGSSRVLARTGLELTSTTR